MDQATVINTGFEPRPLQREVNNKLKRFSVLICHRRFGKTVDAVNLLNDGAVRCPLPDPRFAYIAPLRKQAKAVAWDYLKRFAAPIPGVEFNEGDLRVDYPNGGRVSLYGGNDPDSLRGIYLDGVVFDEVAQMPKRVWTEVIRPALSDRKGWALFIGTPQGKNALWEIYESAKRDPDWCAIVLRASETGIIDPEELAAVKRTMDPDEYEQEFECSFTAAIKGAYFSHLMAAADKDKRIGRIPYDPTVPVHTSWDLGMSDSTSIWFIQSMPGGSFAVIDYYEASGEGLDHYAKVLDEKGYKFGKHIAPHDIRVRELGTGKTRLETSRSLGIRFDIAPNIPVQDGINAIRSILPRCWFDEDKCAAGIESLRHYRREFNDIMNNFKDHPLHDWTSHAVDAFRYFAVGFRPPTTTKLPRRYA